MYEDQKQREIVGSLYHEDSMGKKETKKKLYISQSLSKVGVGIHCELI